MRYTVTALIDRYDSKQAPCRRTALGRTAEVRTKPEQHSHSSRKIMNRSSFFNDLQSKIGQVIENSPAKDLEKNVKAMLSQGFSRLDLVTREEFDVQMQVLAKTRAKVDALEARLAELEALLRDKQGGA
jgi:ubiquinone biosynthesis accessory factor UbiK